MATTLYRMKGPVCPINLAMNRNMIQLCHIKDIPFFFFLPRWQCDDKNTPSEESVRYCNIVGETKELVCTNKFLSSFFRFLSTFMSDCAALSSFIRRGKTEAIPVESSTHTEEERFYTIWSIVHRAAFEATQPIVFPALVLAIKCTHDDDGGNCTTFTASHFSPEIAVWMEPFLFRFDSTSCTQLQRCWAVCMTRSLEITNLHPLHRV